MPPLPQRPPMALMTPDERRKIALAHLKTVQWFVYTQRGGRATVTATATVPVGQSRIRMRIFARGVSFHAMREIIQVLAEESPVRNLQTNGVIQPGVWYHRTAWWVKDAQSVSNGDATYTLFRELSDGPVEETGVVDDGCGNTTTIRYVWDAASIEELTPTGQGFATRVGGVNRDEETGLFSYYVTTTERKTLVTGEYLAADDVFSDTFETKWTGLRGTIDAPLDNDGDAVAVPSPDDAGTGELITVRWDRDPDDCTLSAQVKREVSTEQQAGVSCAKDIFSEKDGVSMSGSLTALGHAPVATGGLVERHESKLRPDKLYDTQHTAEQEFQVLEATKAKTETMFDIDEEVVDRSVPANTSLVPAAPSGGVVQSIHGEKTAGALLNKRTKTSTEKAVTDAVVVASSTIFEEDEESLDRSQPLATSLVPAAPANGVTEQIRGELTQGGLRNIQTKRTTELPVSNATLSSEKTIYETAAEVVDRNQASNTSLAAPDASGGVVVSKQGDKTPGDRLNVRTKTTTERAVTAATLSSENTIFELSVEQIDRNQPAATSLTPAEAADGVIEAIRGEKTPGALLNVHTKTTTERPVTAATLSTEKTLFEIQVDQVDRNQAANTSLTPADVSGGVIHSLQGDKTPGGRLNVRAKTTTERPVSSAVQSRSMTIFEIDETVVDRNQPKGTSLTPADASGGVIHSLHGEKTPGDLLTIQEKTTTERPVTAATLSATTNLYDEETVQWDRAQPLNTSLVPATASGGVIQEKRGEKTAGGLLNVQNKVTTEHAVTAAVIQNHIEYSESTVVQVDKSQSPATSLAPSLTTSDSFRGVLTDKSGKKTPGALLDVTTETSTPVKRIDVLTYSRQGLVYNLTIFRNHTRNELDALLSGLDADDDNMPEIPQRNKYGLFDGRIVTKVADDGSGNDYTYWTNLRLYFDVTTPGEIDTDRTHWFYKDRYYYDQRKGTKIHAALADFSGGHSSSTIETQYAADSYVFRRVYQIERFVFTYGTINGTMGTWTPGALSAQVGSSFNLYNVADVLGVTH